MNANVHAPELLKFVNAVGLQSNEFNELPLHQDLVMLTRTTAIVLTALRRWGEGLPMSWLLGPRTPNILLRSYQALIPNRIPIDKKSIEET